MYSISPSARHALELSKNVVFVSVVVVVAVEKQEEEKSKLKEKEKKNTRKVKNVSANIKKSKYEISLAVRRERPRYFH